MSNIVSVLKTKNRLLVLAESITAGGIAAKITEIPGSSSVLWGGFVTYTNQAKMELLGVKSDTLDNFGPVSRETALEMSKGALAASKAFYSLAITGYAGPDPDSSDTGKVFVAITSKSGNNSIRQFHFEGTRDEIRRASVGCAINMLEDFISRD